MSYERYSVISGYKGEYCTRNIAKFRHQRLRKYILFIFLFSLGFCLPYFFSHCVTFNDNDDPKVRNTVAYETNKYIWRLLDGSVKWSMMLVGSFCLLIFYNWKFFTNIKEKLKTISCLHEQIETKETRKKNTNVNFRSRISTIRKSIGKEKFITILFALVASFFFCNIWFLGECILRTVSAAVMVEDPGFEDFLKNYRIISRVMRMLNSCTNVFIYCLVDRNFRKLFSYYLKRLMYLMTCKCIKSMKPLSAEQDLKNERTNNEKTNSKAQSHPLSTSTAQTR